MAAGILALSTKGKGNVIPGVAIATALMPPLCTAGYGLAMGKASFFFGAFYLFFINTVFISLATYLGVRMMHFRRKQFVNAERLKVVNRYILGVVVLTMLPAGYMTVGIIGKSVTENNIRKFVKNECSFPWHADHLAVDQRKVEDAQPGSCRQGHQQPADQPCTNHDG